MKLGKLHRQAYAAYDLAFSTLASYANQLSPQNHPAKLSTAEIEALTQLSLAVEAWQERIRIHRGKPLPGTLGVVRKVSKPLANAVRKRVSGIGPRLSTLSGGSNESSVTSDTDNGDTTSE